MRLSYIWLKELVNFEETPEKMAELLNMHVANVEKIEKIGQGLDKVIVAEITEIKSHPNADKLQLVKVTFKIHNSEFIIQLVCGAPNIKIGQKVPLALPGAKLPNGSEIKESTIRGFKSEGMLCAEDELGIGLDHTGIYILPNEAKIGESVQKMLELDDAVFEVENKSIAHRADLFGHIGFAREIAAITNSKFKIPRSRTSSLRGRQSSIRQLADKSQNLINLDIRVEDTKLCPRYMAVVMDDVKVGSSPIWLQNRLRSIGIRPINNIVDITNYVLVEIGQPLHTFDYHKISGKQIIIRKAKKREKILALDGQEYKFDKDDLVIADKKEPIALAGIMGGEYSGTTEKTKTIVIESANFNAATVRRTSWRLGLRSESVLHFEKGLPINFPEEGINRAIQLIQELAGGRIVGQIYDLKSELAQAKLTKNKKVLLNLERVNKIIGQIVEREEILSILQSLGFKIQEIDLIKILIELAKEQIGQPYKLGVSTFLEAPKVFDCSSLTRWLYRQIGIELPRVTIEQVEIGESIDFNDLKPGDLIFSKGQNPHFNKKYPNGLGHVGIYIGQGKIVHASWKKKRVVISTLEEFASKKDLRAARRIIQDEKGIVVEVPIFRPDISLEEDLIEEIVRIYGANRIKPRPIVGELKPVEYEPEFILEREIRNILIGFVFDEVYNYSFQEAGKKFNVKIANPLSSEQQYLRYNLSAGLWKNAKKNANYFDEFKIFEIGRVFLQGDDGEVKESKALAGLIYVNQKDVYRIVRGIIDKIGQIYNIRPQIENARISRYNFFETGTETEIRVDNEAIGIFGLLKSDIAGIKDKRPIGIFEIYGLEKLADSSRSVKKYQPISSYPPVKRDLAFLIDKKVTWREIHETIKDINPLIKQIEFFDVFEDKKFGGKRNLAFHIIYQSDKRTLKTEEIEEIQQGIIKKLEGKFKAELRNF